MRLHPLALALLAGLIALVAARPQDAQIKLERKIEPGSALRYRFTAAEFVTVDGDPAASIELNASGEFTLPLTAGADGALQGDVTYGPIFGSVKRGGAEHAKIEIFQGPGIQSGGGPKVTVKQGQAEVAVWNELRGTFAALAAGKTESDVDAIWEGLSLAGAPTAHVGLAFAPLPAAAVAKDARWDAEFFAGRATAAETLRVFYTNVLTSFDESVAKIQQSGKPKLVLEPTAKDAKAPTLKLDADKAYWSAVVSISRKDGLVEAREGEYFAPLEVVPAGAAKDAKGKNATFKAWMKLERIKK